MIRPGQSIHFGQMSLDNLQIELLPSNYVYRTPALPNSVCNAYLLSYESTIMAGSRRVRLTLKSNTSNL